MDTMLATSDSLKASVEAAWGAAEAVGAPPEVPGFDSLVSILWSEADLRLLNCCKKRRCRASGLPKKANRRIAGWNLASASASCLSSRLPASLAEAFRAAASPSSPVPAPDSLRRED